MKMKLSSKEFDAMQTGWREWYLNDVEFKMFEKFGLEIQRKDILEVGCGFHVIIMTEANSYVNTRSLEILPKFKTQKNNSWCAA